MKKDMDMNTMIDLLIENITNDELLFEEQTELLRKTQEEISGARDRLREAKEDLETLMKFATDEQKQRVEESGIDTDIPEVETSSVADMVMEILQNSKDGKMKNQDLYNEYVKLCGPDVEAETYTQFNIKCRSLFNSQRLVKQTEGASSSRDYIISLNGFKPK